MSYRRHKAKPSSRFLLFLSVWTFVFSVDYFLVSSLSNSNVLFRELIVCPQNQIYGVIYAFGAVLKRKFKFTLDRKFTFLERKFKFTVDLILRMHQYKIYLEGFSTYKKIEVYPNLHYSIFDYPSLFYFKIIHQIIPYMPPSQPWQTQPTQTR